MNTSSYAWLSRLLTVGGILETVVALGLLVAPSGLAKFLLQSPLEGAGVVIGRIAGAGLLFVGIACWSARNTPSAPASVGVAWAFLAYNVLACGTLATAAPALARGGLPALSAALLHGMLAVALSGTLLRRRQAHVGS